MYQQSEWWAANGGGGAATLKPAFAPAFGRAARKPRLVDRFAELDLAVDLGANIGSREWWRGLATLAALLAGVWALAPGFARIAMPVAAPLAEHADEARALAIAPLALGADTGKRMIATDAVRPLTDSPERPSIDLAATLGEGDGLARALARAGVAEAEAQRVAAMTATVAPELAPGTRLDVTLGRRPNRMVARPLDHLAFRARFDLRVEFVRVAGALVMRELPIAVDRTPLRLTGRRGDNLYTAARAAGVPAKTVEQFLRALGTKIAMSDLQADDRFDLVVDYTRAETGEVRVGELLYAGLDQGRKHWRLMPWTIGGKTEWFDAAGVGRQRGGMTRPVDGRLTSNFGMRRHPLLGYSRFHKGQDFGAPSGAPIYAATDGVVAYAGRKGGYGNFVGLNHAGGLGTGYGHMSRIAVSGGERVRQGQVIGYVGSTGMSTGPHLHYEVYRNGVAVDPRGVQFLQTALLEGPELAAFRARLKGLLSLPVGSQGAVRH